MTSIKTIQLIEKFRDSAYPPRPYIDKDRSFLIVNSALAGGGTKAGFINGHEAEVLVGQYLMELESKNIIRAVTRVLDPKVGAPTGADTGDWTFRLPRKAKVFRIEVKSGHAKNGKADMCTAPTRPKIDPMTGRVCGPKAYRRGVVDIYAFVIREDDQFYIVWKWDRDMKEHKNYAGYIQTGITINVDAAKSDEFTSLTDLLTA